jgi:hypothetical protein
MLAAGAAAAAAGADGLNGQAMKSTDTLAKPVSINHTVQVSCMHPCCFAIWASSLRPAWLASLLLLVVTA